MAEVAARGFGANVVSRGEWAIARRAGVPNERITLEGVGKTDADLRDAIRSTAAGRTPLAWLALESSDEVHQFGFGFVSVDLVHDLEGHRHDHARIVGQRGLRHQDQELAVLQSSDDFACGLLARELAEELFDVLDFERAGFKRVLLDEIFQQASILPAGPPCMKRMLGGTRQTV